MTLEVPAWESAPLAPALRADEVHVWRARLDAPEERVERLLTTLTPDERERAARLRSSRARRRFVVARGALRGLLGDYLGWPPERLRFRYADSGKPALELMPGEGAALDFNLAHSDDLALYAVARGRRVGVDLERVHPDVDCDAVAARYFSPGECATLAALPPPARRAAFFRGWTRKEAYVKARGEGMWRTMAQLEVTLRPDEPPALVRVPAHPDDAGRWSVADLYPDSDYTAALVVEGPPCRVRCWDMSGV